MCVLRTVGYLLLLAVFNSLLVAQTGDTAAIYGIIQDSSGAVVGGAAVVVRNVETGSERRVVTTDTGDYVVANLPVGAYTVTISKDGFMTFTRTGIGLAVDRRARVDAVLKVGAVTEQVSVTGEAPLIEASVATLKNLVDTKRMEELPLNGRNPLELTQLVPGVQPTSGSFINQAFTSPFQQFISSSGGRGNAVNHVLDGGDNSDSYTNVANVYPNPDALQEFSFQTTNFSAEFGRRLGGVVNAVTRSGTNRFHGSLFEFVRNQEFNATNFFTPGRPDGLKRNQYGVNVGGPIRRDKTFFFASWQGTKIRQLPPTSTAIVPTEAMRNGDFSNFRNASGALIVVRDPVTGTPFPNNQVPTSRFDPVAAKLLANIPVPTDPTGLLRYPVLNTTDDDQVIARVDHTLTASNRLSGRLVYDTLRRGNSILPGSILGGSYTPNFRTYNATISDTHTFTPRLLGVFSFTFNRLWSGYTYGYPVTLADLGAKLYDMSPNKDISLSVANFFSVPGIGAAILVRNNFQYQGALTYVFGRHEMKFGADVLRQRFNIPIAAFQSSGNYSFANSITGSNQTDFMLGRPSSFNQITPWAEALRATGPGFYFQDNFKVTSRFTFNLGLRWEPFLPWVDVRNQETALWRVGAQSTRAPGLPPNLLVVGDPGVPEAGYESSWKKFDPRVGFAYMLPDGKTSIRGGYGIFHEFPNSIVNNRFAVSPPFAVRVDVQTPPSIVDPFTPQNPNPFPTTLPPPPNFVFPRPVLATTYGDAFTNAYAQQWNLTLERQVTTGWLGRISYMGSRGLHLMANDEINPAKYIPGSSSLANVDQRRPYYPNYTSVTRFESTGTSDYNAIAFSVEKRFTAGYSILGSYTFSKSMDFTSAVVAGGSGGNYTNPYDHNYDRALSDFDHKHRFVVSYMWELPKFATSPAALRYTLGGWQNNGIVTLMSGAPFSVLAGSDRSLEGIGADRPDIVGVPALDTSRSKGDKVARYFNTDAFRLNDVGTYGTAGRNFLRAPGTANVDFSVFKNFPIREQTNLQFRTEFFNLFNRTNLGAPTATLSSTLFGRITSAGNPRIIQLALRLTF